MGAIAPILPLHSMSLGPFYRKILRPPVNIAPENSLQPWRICSVETSLAYAIILIFLWNLQYSGNSRYGQEPFPSSGVRHIEKRNLRARG